MKGLQFTRLFVALCAVVLALPPAAPVQAANCQYVLGFATLHNLIPAVVGDCLNNEYHDGLGNGYQNTTNGLMQWRKLDNWTAFTNGYRTWVNGPYGIEQRLNTQRFPWEANLEGLPVLYDGSGVQPHLYYDDRSYAQSLMLSFINALNQKQYLRAYSYWDPSTVAAQIGSLSHFQQGYANTATVQIGFGTIGGDAGAGQFYNSVPVILTAQTTGGAFQVFVGCYQLHISNPGIQGVPPFQPLAIQKGQVQQIALGTDPAPLLAQACQTAGIPEGSPLPPQPAFAPGDISAQRYLDDRSDGVQVVRSLFNAINRFEYVRAYGYWEPNAAQLQPFPQFQQGYANTQSVQLTTGNQTSSAGAGQLYYSVPLTLVSHMSGGSTQTFVGCYRLHLANPLIQGTLPFQPLAIQSATIQQVANNANTAVLMSQICH